MKQPDQSLMQPRSDSRYRIGRRIGGLVGAVVILVSVGSYMSYRLLEQEPLADAQAIIREGHFSITREREWLQFEPLREAIQPSVIFYPGALVAPESYAPLAKRLADAGHRVFIVRMPFDLAVLDVARANNIMSRSEPADRFVIGGHSLGGAMAARYAAAHTERLEGIFMMGAYADDAGDLSDKGLPVLQLTGSRDQILNAEVWKKNRKNLPKSTTYVSIEGGNHSQFGDYGLQKGDGEAAISGQEQLDLTVQSLVDWMDQLQ